MDVPTRGILVQVDAGVWRKVIVEDTCQFKGQPGVHKLKTGIGIYVNRVDTLATDATTINHEVFSKAHQHASRTANSRKLKKTNVR